MAELSSIPEDLTNSFEFTTEDYERIMLTDSLFDDTDTDFATDTEAVVRSLKNLTIRETKQYLHAVTLSDYLRKKMIPRGLRIQKSPALGLNNPKFHDRWCEIVNKCSYDLMALVIKETSDQLAKTKEEISELSNKLDNELTDKAKLGEIKKELEQLKEKHHTETKTYKREKFVRDTRDYTSGNIYFWRTKIRNSIKPQTHRGARYKATPVNWPSSTSADSDSSEPSGRNRGAPFLGNTREDTYNYGHSPQIQPPRGRARGRPRGRQRYTTNGRGEDYARNLRSGTRDRQR